MPYSHLYEMGQTFQNSASSNAIRLFQSRIRLRIAAFEDITQNLQILLIGCRAMGVVVVGVDFWWGAGPL